MHKSLSVSRFWLGPRLGSDAGLEIERAVEIEQECLINNPLHFSSKEPFILQVLQ
jgi:hypothetical protein